MKLREKPTLIFHAELTRPEKYKSATRYSVANEQATPVQQLYATGEGVGQRRGNAPLLNACSQTAAKTHIDISRKTHAACDTYEAQRRVKGMRVTAVHAPTCKGREGERQRSKSVACGKRDGSGHAKATVRTAEKVGSCPLAAGGAAGEGCFSTRA